MNARARRRQMMVIEAHKRLIANGTVLPLSLTIMAVEMADFALEQIGDTDPIPDVVGTVREKGWQQP